jgi:hypothetical protein
VVEYLLSKHEALSLIPSSAKNKQTKQITSYDISFQDLENLDLL